MENGHPPVDHNSLPGRPGRSSQHTWRERVDARSTDHQQQQRVLTPPHPYHSQPHLPQQQLPIRQNGKQLHKDHSSNSSRELGNPAGHGKQFSGTRGRNPKNIITSQGPLFATHLPTPAANEPDSNGKFEEASTPPDTLQKGDSVSEVGGHLTIECQPFITVSPIVYNNLAMVNRHYHQEVFCIRYHGLGPTPHSLSPSGQELFLPRVV